MKDLIITTINVLCYLTIALAIFSELSPKTKDTLLTTSSRTLASIGAFFMIINSKTIISLDFALSVVVMQLGIVLIWSRFLYSNIFVSNKDWYTKLNENKISSNLFYEKSIKYFK